MVVRVAQRALKSGATNVVVAGDSEEIIASCEAHGVRAVLTRQDHPSGSDRLAQACDLLDLSDDALVLNVQGDEPLIEPALIDAVAATLQQRSDCVMSTAACPIQTLEDFDNPNVVKVVLDAKNTALYFSRSPLPFARDVSAQERFQTDQPLRHIGIYGYRVNFLRQFPKLEQAPIEKLESLEQLRALWHGYRIAVHVSALAPGIGVDTPEDLARVLKILT